LQVLTWSERPLQLAEAVDFIAVNVENDPAFDPEDRMPIPTEIVGLCSSLVTITQVHQANPRCDPEGGDRNPDNETVEELRLAHFSVKEYLMSNHLVEPFRMHLLQIPAAACIASVCLTYLQQIEHSDDLEGLKLRYPLAYYSAEYWTRFARQAETSDEAVKTLALLTLSIDKSFSMWLSIYDPDRPWRRDSGIERQTLPRPLYYASLEGMAGVSKALIHQGADIDARGGEYGNALQAACFRGYTTVVSVLLDQGADLNAQVGQYGNALQAACCGGHEKIVELLLNGGASVNACGTLQDPHTYIWDYEVFPLYTASIFGYDEIANLLLQSGAKVNEEGGQLSNALQAACFGGHEKVVKTLLKNGADVNAQGGEYTNPLQAACYNGHKKLAKILVDEGAKVNTQGGIYGNALQTACARGDEETAKMLLSKGAEVNAQGGRYCNAILAAYAGGHEQLAGVLIQNGAVTSVQGGSYSEVFEAACAEGDAKMVNMLLGNGAEVNTQGGWYGNVLQAASIGGSEAVVKILLAEGADINAQGGEYGNALQAACYRGYESVAKMVLDHRTHVVDARGNGCYNEACVQNCVEGQGRTLTHEMTRYSLQMKQLGDALLTACSRGHKKTIQMLIDNGADVNYKGDLPRWKGKAQFWFDCGENVNSLYVAAYLGSKQILSLLLDSGVDIDARIGSHGSALHASNCIETAQLLLNRGAISFEEGTKFRSASVEGFVTIRKKLLYSRSKITA
jgi:ankyrin repeat protein